MNIIEIGSLNRLLLKLSLNDVCFFDSKEVFNLIESSTAFNSPQVLMLYAKALYLNSIYLMLFNTGYDQDFICSTFHCDYDQDNKVYGQLKELHDMIHELKAL